MNLLTNKIMPYSYWLIVCYNANDGLFGKFSAANLFITLHAVCVLDDGPLLSSMLICLAKAMSTFYEENRF